MSEIAGEFHDTGIRHHVQQQPVMPKHRPGEHLWVMALVHQVDNPASWASQAGDPRDRVLGMHNLINHMGPFCFWCEQPWTAQLEKKRCSGDPGVDGA